MFEAAAAAKIGDERVVFVRQLTEDLVSFFDDLGYVDRKFFKVVIALAGHHDPMRFALHGKRYVLKITYLEGRIVENIEVRGLKCVFAARDYWQAGGDAPRSEWQDLNGRGRLKLVFRKHQKCRVVPKSMIVVQLIGAYRQLIGVNAICCDDLLCSACSYLPGILVCLLPVESRTGRILNSKILHVSCVLANEVASRRPYRHLKLE